MQILNKIARNRDARTLVSNFAWLSALQVASYLFPLITMPYLARVIGAGGFGKIAFASAVMIWIRTISDWGFNYTATRDVAQNKNSKRRCSLIFSEVLWARCLLMVISFAFLLVLIYIIPAFRDCKDVLLVTFLMIPGHILFPEWYFQAIERMKYITILNVLTKLLFTVIVFLIIRKPEDYIYQPLLIAIGYAISGLISIYLVIAKWKICIFWCSWHRIMRALKKSSDVFVNTLVPNFYNSFSVVLLGVFGGSVSVGILDGGNRFIQVANQFLMVLSRTFYPLLSRRIEQHKRFVCIMLACACVMAIALFVGANYLVKFFLAPEFVESAVVLKIRAFSIVFYAMSIAYGTNYLIITRQERVVRNITMIGSFLGFIALWPFVYFYGYIGASVTVACTLGLIGLGCYFAAKAKH